MCAYAQQNNDDRLCELLKIIHDENQYYITNMISPNTSKYISKHMFAYDADNYASCKDIQYFIHDKDAIKLIDYIAQNIDGNIYNNFKTPESHRLRYLSILVDINKTLNRTYEQEYYEKQIKDMKMRKEQIKNMNENGLEKYLNHIEYAVNDCYCYEKKYYDSPDYRAHKADFIKKANDLLDSANIDYDRTNKSDTLEMIDSLGLDYVFFICVYAQQNNNRNLYKLLEIINDKNQRYIIDMILVNKPKHCYYTTINLDRGDEDAIRLIHYIARNINKNIYDTFKIKKSNITTDNVRKKYCEDYKEHHKKYHATCDGQYHAKYYEGYDKKYNNSGVSEKYLCKLLDNQQSQKQSQEQTDDEPTKCFIYIK